MTTRKRWQKHYAELNPFALPQAVHQAVKERSEATASDTESAVRYLWIVLGGLEKESPRSLSEEEWLSVVDEAASRGADTLIISAAGELADYPEIAAISGWAQNAYGMLVGIHLRDYPLSREGADTLRGLEADNTCVLAHSDLLEGVEFVEELGLRLIAADGLAVGAAKPGCDLPTKICCMGDDGNLYTCGLVLGEQRYRLGNYFDAKLKEVLTDDSLPHFIPQEVSEARHRCEGCPPRLARLMRNPA